MRAPERAKGKRPPTGARGKIVRLPICNGQSAPIDGLYSLIDPSLLKLGMFRRIEGFRWDKGLFTTRDGSVALSSAIVSSGEYRGKWSGTLNGTATTALAMKDTGTSKTWLLVCTNYSTFAFTEVTASSGPYGNTRLDPDAFVSFTSERDPYTDRDVLIASNGVDAWRIYDPQGDGYSGSTTVAIHDTVTPPSDGSDHRVRAGFNSAFAITGTTLTHTNAAAELEGSTVNAGTNEQYALLTMFAAVDVGDQYVFQSSASTAATSGTAGYMVWLVETTYDEFPDHLTLAVRRASDSAYQDFFTAGGHHFTWDHDSANNRYYIAFPWNLSTSTAYDRIRATWVGTAPSANQTLKIYGIWFSGTIQGNTQVAIGYGSHAGRSDSYSRIVSPVSGMSLLSMGGTALGGTPVFGGPTIPGNESLLMDERMSYIYAFDLRAPTTAGSTDRARVYLKPPGAFTYMWAKSATDADFWLSSWDGAAWTDLTSGGRFRFTLGSNNLNAVTLQPVITRPDSQHKCGPRAKYLFSSNERTFAGNVASARSEVWISKEKVPWHYRKATIFLSDTVHDARSPTSVSCGTEIVQGFGAVPSSSPTDPENTVYLLTDLHVWSFAGDLSLGIRRKECDVGTLSPRSITTFRRTLFFLDSEMQVSAYSQGRLESLSRFTVDDKFQAIPAGRRDDVEFVAFREGLDIAYSSSGATTNDRFARFNFLKGKWEADEPFPTGMTGEALFVLEDRTANRRRLVTVASDRKLYEYEQPGLTTDLGSSIATRLTFTIAGNDLFDTAFLRRVGVYMDDVSSGSVAISVTVRHSGQVQTLTAPSVDVSISRAYRWSRVVPSYSNTALATQGPELDVDLQVTSLGGKNIYALVAEVDAKGQRADAV